MKPSFLVFILLFAVPAAAQPLPPDGHPDTSGPEWKALFKPDLSDAIAPEGVWTVEDGVITASEDKAVWSERPYDDYILDLEFKNAEGTNSGVIVHTNDLDRWIPNSVEIQIADDYSEKWSKADPTWQAGAIFGHQAAGKRTVKRPGEWNRMTVATKGPMIWVLLNGELVNTFDMSRWTSAKTNPDGSAIPAWLNKPKAELPTHGHIGLQGKHAGAPIYFRNIRIRELK